MDYAKSKLISRPGRSCFALAIAFIALAASIPLFPSGVLANGGAAKAAEYVGSEKCKECHEEAYGSYMKNSQKAHSFASIKTMMPQLTPQEIETCYKCHTTGYGEPGGFVSEEKTPHLANAGCEVCHGPGSIHMESEDPKDINSNVSIDACGRCHNEERVGAFKYKPLIYGGGH